MGGGKIEGYGNNGKQQGRTELGMVTPTGAAVQGVSLNPETFTEGGGPPPPQNLLVTYLEVKGNYQYVNRDGMPMGNPACVAEVHTTGDDGEQRTQLYSVGPAVTFTASEDGSSIIPLGAQKSISKSSNLGILLTELSGCGFPADRLGANLREVLQGLYAYFDQKEQPKRPGLEQTPEQAARGPRMISVPTQIHNLPWEASKSPHAARIGQQSVARGAGVAAAGPAAGVAATGPMAAPGSAPAPIMAAPVAAAPPITQPTPASLPAAPAGPSAPAPADPAAEALATNTLNGLRASNPAALVSKPLLIPAAYAAMGTDPGRNAAIALINDDPWLSQHGLVADAAGGIVLVG